MVRPSLFHIFVLLIFAGMLLVCAGFFFDRADILDSSWNYYKSNFISKDGRVIDPQREDSTTSEGQAYALLRAALVNDRKEFDLVLNWTQNNLKRKKDNLYSWLWGKNSDGKWEVLDKNAASDADIDIASSLIIAYHKWQDKAYLVRAKKIIKDIWKLETAEIKGKRVLISGIEQAKAANIEINPSYFAPYAFKLFAGYDKKHNWQSIADSSYELLDRITALSDSGLPPDWFLMDAKTGEIKFDENCKRACFSYDAIRTFIRIYADYKLYGDKRAEKFLSKVKFFLDKNKEQKDGMFYTQFDRNGKSIVDYENTEFIALLLPVIKIYDGEKAFNLFKEKVQKYYKQGYWKDPKNYYTQNLVWIGVWVYLNDKEISAASEGAK